MMLKTKYKVKLTCENCRIAFKCFNTQFKQFTLLDGSGGSQATPCKNCNYLVRWYPKTEYEDYIKLNFKD